MPDFFRHEEIQQNNDRIINQDVIENNEGIIPNIFDGDILNKENFVFNLLSVILSKIYDMLNVHIIFFLAMILTLIIIIVVIYRRVN